MNVLDLFSGIGGFSLGLERAGLRTVAFCERNAYAQRVLRKHWPAVPIYDDVRTLTGERLRSDGIAVDVVCGGFPCQDISGAGNGAGIDGPQSGLWRHFARIIGEVRPRFVIVENVAALLVRGLGNVLGDLAALGYDAEWHCIPASHIGAPHRRDRVWIIAHTECHHVRQQPRWCGGTCGSDASITQQHGGEQLVANTNGGRCEEHWFTQHSHEPLQAGNQFNGCGAGRRGNGAHVGNARGARLSLPECQTIFGAWWAKQGRTVTQSDWWTVEPHVGRMAHGVSKRVDRLRCLGNAVVPQIPELIGRALMEYTA